MWVDNEIFAKLLDSTFIVFLRLCSVQTRTANQKSCEKRQELTDTVADT